MGIGLVVSKQMTSTSLLMAIYIDRILKNINELNSQQIGLQYFDQYLSAEKY